MAKNKTFRRRYTIDLRGVSTNNFMQSFVDKWLGTMMIALAKKFAQLNVVAMSAEEIETSSKLKLEYKCKRCGASKHTEGGTCLFCAWEDEGDGNANIQD